MVPVNKGAVSNFYYKSQIGSVLGSAKNNNQDCYIIEKCLSNTASNHFFAVCDGHGIEGHHVSQLIKSAYLSILKQKMVHSSPLEALKTSVEEMSSKVLKSKIDTNFSGSTFVSVLLIENVLFCANIGDSRAVLGRADGEAVFAIDLSSDHKPNRKDESDRIISHGGRIASYDHGGPLRIWYRKEELPGLAMTRSIGDKISRNIGLISVPEIVEKQLTCNDKFLIIASDGVWEFLSSQDAVDIVSGLIEKGNPEICCDKLVDESTFRWRKNSMTVDDITVIVIFLSVR